MKFQTCFLGKKKKKKRQLFYVICITKTCLCNFVPLKPFYIVKLEFTGYTYSFPISAQCFEQKYEKYQIFYLNFSYFGGNFQYICIVWSSQWVFHQDLPLIWYRNMAINGGWSLMAPVLGWGWDNMWPRPMTVFYCFMSSHENFTQSAKH